MVVSTTIKMDLMNKSTFGATPRVKVMQNDRYSRNILFLLYDNGNKWDVPKESEIVVRFVRKNGTGGNYNTMPDGTEASTYYSNELTVKIAPAVTTLPGSVRISVGIILGEQEINTFSVDVDVEENPGIVATSENYYKILGSLADSGWTPNKYLGTDASGNVVTKNAPEGTGGTGETAKSFAVTETDTTVTMVLETENGSHIHVLNFDANGYPTSITVDGVAIPGTWEVAASE